MAPVSRRLQICAYLCLFYIGGLSMTFYYKWVLRDDFPFPFMFSLFNGLLSFAISVIWQRWRDSASCTLVPSRQEIIGVNSTRFFVFNLLTSIIGLLGGTLDTFAFFTLPVSIGSVVTISMPAWTALFYVVYEKGRISRAKIATILLLLSGIILTVASPAPSSPSISPSSSSPSPSSPSIPWLAVAASVTALALASLNNCMTCQMMRDFSPWFTDFNITIYTSLYSTAGFLPVCLWFEGRAFVKFGHTHALEMYLHLVVVTLAQLAMQIVIQRIMNETSSVTYSMIRACRTVASILIALFIVRDSPVTPMKLAGVALAALSLITYAWLENRQKKTPA